MKFRTLVAVAAIATAGLLVGCGAETSSAESGTQESEEGGFLSRLLPGGSSKQTVTLPAGHPIAVRTTNTLSTKSNASGETFVGSLNEPLTAGGVEVAPAGSTVTGRITTSDAGGRVKGVASIGLSIDEIRTPDGLTIPVATNSYVRQAKKTHTKDAQKVGIGAGAGAVIGAIAGGGSGALKGAGVGAGAGTGAVLATRGDPAVIAAESVIGFTLADSVNVTL